MVPYILDFTELKLWRQIGRTTMSWPYNDLEFRNLGSINRNVNMENYIISIKLYIQNNFKIIK